MMDTERRHEAENGSRNMELLELPKNFGPNKRIGFSRSRRSFPEGASGSGFLDVTYFY